MNDMQSMHDAANKAYERRLSDVVLGLRGSIGDFRKAVEKPTGRALARIDEAQFVIDQECHIGGDQGKVGHE